MQSQLVPLAQSLKALAFNQVILMVTKLEYLWLAANKNFIDLVNKFVKEVDFYN